MGRSFSQLRRTPTLVALIAGLPLVGCGEEPSPATSATVRDSAGVRIVENGALESSSISADPEPVFRTGWADGEPAFQSISTGFLDDDGGAVVGDGGLQIVYLLAADGVDCSR